MNMITEFPWTLSGQKFTAADGGQVSLGIYMGKHQILRPTVSVYVHSKQAQAIMELAAAAPAMLAMLTKICDSKELDAFEASVQEARKLVADLTEKTT